MAILTNGPHAVDGAIGEIITGGECKTLQGLLKLLRSKKHPAWLETFLERLTFGAEHPEHDEPIDVKEMLRMLLASVNEDIKAEALDALLYFSPPSGDDTLTPVDGDEHETLLRYLAVQRSGSWLAEFMDVECRIFETHKQRTPEEVIRGLVGSELPGFDCDVRTTKKMLKLHPDLFTSGKESITMSPAEFEEVEKHLKAMRARKPRKGKKAAA